jgi:hypothetical protein
LSDDLTDILGAAYATYPPEGKVKAGVICVAVVPYVMEKCYAVRPSDPDPKSPSHKQYKIKQEDVAALATNNQSTWRLPFKDLNLDTDEDLLIVKVKRRPVVVLSRALVDECQADTSRTPDSFWCIPSYTLVDQFFHSKYEPEFIDDVNALTYRSFFPLPYEPHLHDRQAMLRFERMQPIPRHLLKPTELRLTPEWVLYLQEWARFYITGRLGDDDTDKNSGSIPSILNTARDLLMKEVAKKKSQTPKSSS